MYYISGGDFNLSRQVTFHLNIMITVESSSGRTLVVADSYEEALHELVRMINDEPETEKIIEYDFLDIYDTGA